MRSWLRACVCAVLIGVFAEPAMATVVRDRPLSELVARAPVVVWGRVAKQGTDWGPDRRQILTHTHISVTKAFKGSSAPDVVIEQVGGTVGELRQSIVGDARFTVGEEVVVLLEPHPLRPGLYVLTGMASTKFTVRHEGSTRWIERDLSGLALAAPGPDGMLRPVEGRQAPQRFDWSQLEQALRTR